MNTEIIVEYRPKLRACQFYVKASFDEDTFEIELLNNCVTISDYRNRFVIKFPPSCNHIENSVSGLSFTDESLCFRSRTTPPDKKFGSYEREVILKEKKQRSTTYRPPIKIGELLKIYCRNCLAPLTYDEVYFDRILPLPISSSSEDFFCHHRPSSEGQLASLDPRLHDCLYGLYCYKVNPCIFETDLLGDDNNRILYCARCSSWLGLVQPTSVQLWNDTTIISDIDPMAGNDVAVQDLLAAIHEALSEKYSGGIASRIVFECPASFVDGHYVNEYLLVWVMEENLKLFVSQTDDAASVPAVELEEQVVSKLLYTHASTKDATVREWLEMVAVNVVQISRSMLTKGLQHLKAMSESIPATFRTANSMDITYVRKIK